jgi:hypothetical protein
MPELSRFFGIVIRMFAEEGDQHHLPHFHAEHGDRQGVFFIKDGEVFTDMDNCSLDRRDVRLVLAWAEINMLELEQAWDQLNSEDPQSIKIKIKPLTK